jgi:hypothetical protein
MSARRPSARRGFCTGAFSLRRPAVSVVGLLLIACGSDRPSRITPPEPRIVAPATPELAKLSGHWVGQAQPATEIRWNSSFGGAPELWVDVETVNDDGMQVLIVMGDGWVRLFLNAKPSPQHGIYEGRHAEGPSLYWFRLRLVRDSVLGFEMERNTPEPAGVLVRTQLHRP